MATHSPQLPHRLSILLFFILLTSSTLLFLLPNSAAEAARDGGPTPAPWPHQFHAFLFMNNSGSLMLVDLWYDWPNGRNFNIIRNQLDGSLLYDLEWNNGTSFYYRLDSTRECRTLHFEVGILHPSWLDGANYLGQRNASGFLCNVWEKVDFIWYYEDVITKRPVQWFFYTGLEAYVMTYEVGAALEDSKWQAPSYCFEKDDAAGRPNLELAITRNSHEGLLDGVLRGFERKKLGKAEYVMTFARYVLS